MADENDPPLGTEENKTVGKYTNSDRLGIALTCLAGAMAIILSLVEKTPFTVIGLLLLVVALLVYPVLHFAKRSMIRVGLLICAALVTAVFGWGVWPKHKISVPQITEAHPLEGQMATEKTTTQPTQQPIRPIKKNIGTKPTRQHATSNVPAPCLTPFRPGIFVTNGISENGTTALGFGSASRVTGINNTARSGAAMIDVGHLGTGNFDNNTTVGNSELLKADSADEVSVTNNTAYADPNARPGVPAIRPYNVGDWFDFLDDYEGFTGEKEEAKAESEVNHLRERLTLEWKSLPTEQRLANRKELEEVLTAIKGVNFNAHYRDWPPSFVTRPCN
jgi:hypothetical protein